MMKLTDYITQFLVDRGVPDVFLVSGGQIMHLLDSVGQTRGMNYYCNYHEQACAVSAEAYARVRTRPGVCMVTVGPGAANALSGIVGAWVDSVPLIVFSGQLRKVFHADFSKVRQIGPQESDAIAMAKPVTKYAVRVTDPQSIRYHLERAWHEATSGRPGPAWIELPMDVQATEIDETALPAFAPEGPAAGLDAESIRSHAATLLDALRSAKRPVLIPGNGVWMSGAQPLFHELVDRLSIPVVLPHTAKDVMEEDHPMTMGVFGTAGQRRANFTIQNADLMVALAAGLNIQKIGFNVDGFAPKARKIVVDIDPGQLHHQILKPDTAIQCDVHPLLEEMLRQLGSSTSRSPEKWLNACARWKERYPIVEDEPYPEHVHAYHFTNRLSDFLTREDIVITGNGMDAAAFFNGFKIKRGQRGFDSGWGSMGWCLPMAVGACIGSGKRRTICVTGDGSIQWNVQELMTIHHNRLPIKIFVFNNRGYTACRATQNSFFEGRFVGSDPASGVSNPDFEKLAGAYGLTYGHIANHDQLESGICAALSRPEATLYEVNISPAQLVSPKASAFRRPDGTFESRPLEDMAPFLSREEVWENMHMFDED